MHLIISIQSLYLLKQEILKAKENLCKLATGKSEDIIPEEKKEYFSKTFIMMVRCIHLEEHFNRRGSLNVVYLVITVKQGVSK